MQNRLTPGFIQRMRQQQRMSQMMGRRGDPRRGILRPEANQRPQPMQQGRPLFNQGRINPDFSITVANPDLRGPNKTQNQPIDPKFKRPTQGGK